MAANARILKGAIVTKRVRVPSGCTNKALNCVQPYHLDVLQDYPATLCVPKHIWGGAQVGVLTRIMHSILIPI